MHTLFTQSILEPDHKVKRASLKITSFSEWYSQNKVEVKLPRLKFKTTLGHLEALLPCIEMALKEVKKNK